MSGTTDAPQVVLGVTGGIAAYKAVLLLRALTESGADVRVVPTEAALRFVGAPTWEALSGHPVSTSVWQDVPGVEHVRLGQTADLIVVAPATADFMARAVAGMADDLLTTTLLAARCPVLMAPAMHTEMWQHPATVANVRTLRERGVCVFDPASGRLTGADTGPGRFAEPASVALSAQAWIGAQGRRDLVGKRVVVSAGGTREALDPVRYLTNKSSGKQGYAIAAAAQARGADVVLVTTADRDAPLGVRVECVTSARELADAMSAEARHADVVVMTAAVSDYRPAQESTHKLKKSGESGVTVELVQNPDILADLVKSRCASQVIVGFAAETGDATASALEYGQAKLSRKGCDLLVVNSVAGGATFGADETEVTVLDTRGGVSAFGPGSKLGAAHHLFDCVESYAR